MNEKVEYTKRSYLHHYMALWRYGLPRSPRGMGTKYLPDVKFKFYPGCSVRRAHDNPAIGFIELLQFVAGVYDEKSLRAVAPNAKLHLFGENSAYGPRAGAQIPGIVRELKSDPLSRRATIVIARPEDTPETMPCTVSMGFQILMGELITTVTMRSSDVMWGLPYDMIQFGGIALIIAELITVPAGLVTVNIANAHVYDDHNLGPKPVVREMRFSWPRVRDIGAEGWASFASNTLNSVKHASDVYAFFDMREWGVRQ